MLAINLVPVDSQAFSLYGLQPAAGRFFPAEPGQAAAASTARFVINQTAVKRLGFTSAESSIGQPITTQSELPYGNMTGDIVGVVPDFSLTSVKEEIAPVAYYVSRNCGHINVKLTGRAIPETLAAVDLLWKAAGAPYPIKRYFLDDHIQNLYLTMLRETQLFGFFAGIAILLACLGLTGLAASTVQRRTGEIGLRKAMGATTGQITRLLLWEFSRPVLWASLIAWPASAILMNRWLEGFAYHVDLDPLLFVAATAFALVIALLTVSAHCYLVARSKPVKALRHE